MKCPRCLNTDRSYFYKGSRGWYCRRCISFGRVMLEEDSRPAVLSPVTSGSEEYVLQYPLTPYQKEISHRCALSAGNTDVLIHAVCGAGEYFTPIVPGRIAYPSRLYFPVDPPVRWISSAQRLAFARYSRMFTLPVSIQIALCTMRSMIASA